MCLRDMKVHFIFIHQCHSKWLATVVNVRQTAVDFKPMTLMFYDISPGKTDIIHDWI